jgi:hypothetical protein
MSRFFSQTVISSLEVSVNQWVQRLCGQASEHRDANVPVNLSNAFRRVAGDVVSQYSLPQGLHNLDSEDFADSYNCQSRTISHIAIWNRHLGFVISLFLTMPRWMVVKMATKDGVQAFDVQAVRRFFVSRLDYLLLWTCWPSWKNLKQQAYHVVNSEKAKTTEKGGETILNRTMESDLPASDKTVDRLYQEALTTAGACTESAGGTLDTITYHVLANPEILKPLKAELTRAFLALTDSTSYESARRLPSLSASN